MAELTEWLKLMLAEIARKREDTDREQDEAARRQKEDSGDASMRSKQGTSIAP